MSDPARRPVGRPPKINREMIAEAARDLGLADLTLRAVADRLGVSVAGLYHHIDGKDDLMRLAAEHVARRTAIPQDRDQHWAVWLREWAHYNRDVFISEPELLGQFLEGAISAESIARNTDAIFGLLVRQGFTLEEADGAYGVVSGCAIGSAVRTIRERHATSGVRSFNDHGHTFEDEIATVLIGIAVRRGNRWRTVKSKLLEAAAADERAPRGESQR